MPSNTPAPSAGPPDNNVRLVIKLALLVSLVALVASVALLFRKRKVEEVQASEAAEAAGVPEQASPDPSPTTEPDSPRRRRALSYPFRGVPARPLPAQPPELEATARPGPDSRAVNIWGSEESARTGYWLAARLPELRSGIAGVSTSFEAPVFYRVPLEQGTGLSNQLAMIRTATNDLIQFDAELKELSASADRDHKEYVQQAKLANAQRRAEANAAMNKLTDLQALYLERKREFQLDSARLKPQLQDSPAQFEAKLALYQKAAAAYKTDIDALETAIHTLQKQNAAMIASLGTQDENIERAYELSAQDAIGQLNVLSNRVQSKLVDVNNAIRDYNARLGLYGASFSPPR